MIVVKSRTAPTAAPRLAGNSGAQLARYLQAHALTLADFAPKVGVTASAVQLWATGKRIPRRRHMAAITKATGGAIRSNDFFEA